MIMTRALLLALLASSTLAESEHEIIRELRGKKGKKSDKSPKSPKSKGSSTAAPTPGPNPCVCSGTLSFVVEPTVGTYATHAGIAASQGCVMASPGTDDELKQLVETIESYVASPTSTPLPQIELDLNGGTEFPLLFIGLTRPNDFELGIAGPPATVPTDDEWSWADSAECEFDRTEYTSFPTRFNNNNDVGPDETQGVIVYAPYSTGVVGQLGDIKGGHLGGAVYECCVPRGMDWRKGTSSMSSKTKISYMSIKSGSQKSSKKGMWRTRKRPTRRRPFKGVTKGKGVPVTTEPPPPQSKTIQVDFSDASQDNPIRLVDINPEDGEVEVEVVLPQDNVEVFTVQDGDDVLPGSSCPPRNGEPVPVDSTTITISIAGVNTVIVLCRGGEVVATCVHAFIDVEEYNASNFQGSITVDFSGASLSNPLGFNLQYGPGAGDGAGAGGGTVGSFLFPSFGSGGGFFFLSGQTSQTYQIGDPCPPTDAILLDPIDGFDLTIFTIEGEDETIYACDGVIIGICELEYVPEVAPPSIPSTEAPSASPSTFPSFLPTFSCADCDDNDLCTIDSCDRYTGECSFEPVVCGEEEACDSFTGLCENLQTVVPCVAVIDEWNNINYASQWAQLRSLYPRRPFCLLVPSSSIQTRPTGFDNDTVNNPDGIDRTLAATVNRDGGNVNSASDWFSSCQLDLLSPSSVPFVGLFIDTSGSMTLNTVRASYNKFLDDLNAANLTYAQVFNSNEQWVTPFITTLAP